MNEGDRRAYLLGQASEADAERVEIQAIEDEDFFVLLRSAEDDLLDDYVRGTLADADLPPFLARYSSQRSRLLAARALRAKATPVAASSHASSRFWMLAAAAALLTGVGVALGIRSRPVPAPDPAAVATANPASVSAPVALVLTLGNARSAAAPPEAVLPPSAATLELRVRIDPADIFDRYAMELRSDRGVIIWRADSVGLSNAGAGPTLVGDVPAALLRAASYELTVRGLTAASQPEVLGFVEMKIRR